MHTHTHTHTYTHVWIEYKEHKFCNVKFIYLFTLSDFAIFLLFCSFRHFLFLVMLQVISFCWQIKIVLSFYFVYE